MGIALKCAVEMDIRNGGARVVEAGTWSAIEYSGCSGKDPVQHAHMRAPQNDREQTFLNIHTECSRSGSMLCKEQHHAIE
jgi:hypothetical protein